MQTILLLTVSNIFMTIAWLRASEAQGQASVERNSGQLSDRLRRVLLPGAGVSDYHRGSFLSKRSVQSSRFDLL